MNEKNQIKLFRDPLDPRELTFGLSQPHTEPSLTSGTGQPRIPKKHESTTQPGLFFWAERIDWKISGPESYHVISQAEGYPETEAHDDWFHYEKDADEIAQMLARGEL